MDIYNRVTTIHGNEQPCHYYSWKYQTVSLLFMLTQNCAIVSQHNIHTCNSNSYEHTTASLLFLLIYNRVISTHVQPYTVRTYIITRLCPSVCGSPPTLRCRYYLHDVFSRVLSGTPTATLRKTNRPKTLVLCQYRSVAAVRLPSGDPDCLAHITN